MKIVLAPDSYKGSLSARAVAEAMRDGVLLVVPDAETVLVPVADGGDGTLETLVDSTGGAVESVTVTGPLGAPVTADWGALGDGNTALVEMARTSGLAMVPPDRRDPRLTTTYGLGDSSDAKSGAANTSARSVAPSGCSSIVASSTHSSSSSFSVKCHRAGLISSNGDDLRPERSNSR